MYTENDNETNDAVSTYDSNLLSGNFNELDSVPEDQLKQSLLDAETALNNSKSLKGTEKTLTQINALVNYANSLALKGKCVVEQGTSENVEGLLSFICVRCPSLELDWTTLQRIISVLIEKNIDYQEQKTLELALTLYISAIKRELSN